MLPAEPELRGRLTGRRILITGGASGIGARTAALCVREGARVVIADRDADRLGAVAAACGAMAVPIDVTDPAMVKSGVAEAARLMNGIDGLANCAGISISEPFADTDAAMWDLAIAVNLSGAYHICHAALPWLKRAAAAAIVNVGSAVAHQPLANRAAYAASKGGLYAFTKVLAMELAPRIRCNILSPGAVETPMVTDMFTDPAMIERITARYAMRRMGQPEELAEAILYLLGPESSFVTGSTLAVDGGRVFY